MNDLEPLNWDRASRDAAPGQTRSEGLGRAVAALALAGALAPGLGALLERSPWWEFAARRASSYGALRPWLGLLGLLGVSSYAALLLCRARWFFRCGFTTATWTTWVLLWAALLLGSAAGWSWLGFLACVPGTGILWAATVLALEEGQRGHEGRGTWREAPSALGGAALGFLALHTLLGQPGPSWTGCGLGWLTGGYLATRHARSRA